MSSYKVLARKWRPQRFDDMIGQEHVVRALANALDTGRLHHAYLFTGMRGVGKTTVARIFAKCLNCETNGVSANPCGECSTCQDIDAGRFFDLIEVDAASRTKVDETRELLENVPYAPGSGRYKVYLIDEVHMFSTHSFNALLKTLEEPPEHVKFLLATTDPQKLPLTVLSRCLQFNLKRMGSTPLANYLARILDSESAQYERSALELISRAAEGSVRDSLSLVEQAMAFGGGAVQENDVESMLGRVSSDRLVSLLASIADGDATALFEKVDKLAEYAPDYEQLLAELLSLLHRLAMMQSVPGAVSSSASTNDSLSELATRCAADEVQLYYQIGLNARRDMPFAPDQKEAFDMALLRMLAFAPQAVGLPEIPNAATASGLAANAATPVKGSISTTTDASQSASATQVPKDVAQAEKKTEVMQPEQYGSPASAQRHSSAALTANTPPQADAIAIPNSENKPPVQTGDKFSEKIDNKLSEKKEHKPFVTIADKPSATTADKSVAAATTQPMHVVALDSLSANHWHETIVSMGLSGMSRELASHCVFHRCEGNKIVLQLEQPAEHLKTSSLESRLHKALSKHTASDIELTIDIVEEELNTPARIAAGVRDDALQAARVSINEDPLLKELVSEVDGVVDENSVEPVSEASVPQ